MSERVSRIKGMAGEERGKGGGCTLEFNTNDQQHHQMRILAIISNNTRLVASDFKQIFYATNATTDVLRVELRERESIDQVRRWDKIVTIEGN